jgi:hypothetical protein
MEQGGVQVSRSLVSKKRLATLTPDSCISCMQVNSSIISNNLAVGQGGAVAVLNSSTQVPHPHACLHET